MDQLASTTTRGNIISALHLSYLLALALALIVDDSRMRYVSVHSSQVAVEPTGPTLMANYQNNCLQLLDVVTLCHLFGPFLSRPLETQPYNECK